MKINVTPNSSQKIPQKFSFFTEESWNGEKEKYGDGLEGLFSGKKQETFILLEDDSVNFLIGLGKKPKDFEVQNTAEKFSYDSRKKIRAQTTLLVCFGLNNTQIENSIKGLFIFIAF